MATTPYRFAGTAEPMDPQPTTVPSAFSARLTSSPAEIATTLLSPAGGVAGPRKSFPQPATEPSARKASACLVPAATATTFVKPGGTAGPQRPTTVPGADFVQAGAG